MGPDGIVRGIAVRPDGRAAMIEVDEQRATTGRGLEGDRRAKGKRGLTLLSAERWADAMRELGQILPWHTRRANILVEGIDLSMTIGKRITVGDVLVRIWDETRPCAEMDEFCPGLKDALKPFARGGVHGEILCPGTIRRGDGVVLLDTD